ncbi:MAG: serine/threonine-protein kinase [Janthinobacterium lividum]
MFRALFQKAGPLISQDRDPKLQSELSPAEAAPVLPGITLRAQPFSRGPLAAIYRGWDRVHRCDVIVKVQRATDDPIAMNRFQREAAVMLRLRHPSIVTLYDTHETNPAALIMEYVPGQTLAALVAADGYLAPARAARIIEEIAGALDCVHAVGIVHRDVKPSNILLPARGPAKLTDFGVARIDDDLPLTVMGDILGTIEYASPEQVHGNGAIDTRSDVYSLAAVTYFILTGTPPFRAADNSTQAQLSVMHRQVFAEPPPLRFHRPELTPAIEESVLRGLAKAPEARYASAGQFAAALRAAAVAASGEPQQSAVDASSRQMGAKAGALAAAVLLLAGFALWRTGRLSPHAPITSASAPIHRPSSPLVAAVPHRQKPSIKAASVKPSLRPVLVAQKPKPQTAKPPAKQVHLAEAVPRHLVLPAKQGWLLVYAKQNVAGLGRPEKIAAVPAQKILVDGKAAPTLAAGHWISVSAGRHWISFYPWSKSGFGPRTRVPVSVASGSHVGHQIPLVLAVRPAQKVASAVKPVSRPLVPISSAEAGWYTVSGWAAVANQIPVQKALLVRADAQWIKIDGQPLPSLAQGQWATLPAGKHLVTFQPILGLGVGAKTWAIDIAPKAHLSQQVPLPAAPLPAIPPHLRNP